MYDPDQAHSWIIYGDESYIATRLLWFTGQHLNASVAGHRTIELYLKAYLVSSGASIQPSSEAWGHSLQKLGDACQSHSADFAIEAVSRRLGFLDQYFELVRYPSNLEKLPDGQLLWFSYDANISPLDELVAFIRPRVQLEPSEWTSTPIHLVRNGESADKGFQRRAIEDANEHLSEIDCCKSDSTTVDFDEDFSYDLPGC